MAHELVSQPCPSHRFPALKIACQGKVVLPDRIELSTSPLPMECSTTELRQHARYMKESALKAPYQAGGSCHKDPSGASTRAGREGAKIVKNRRLLLAGACNEARPRGNGLGNARAPRGSRLSRAARDAESYRFAAAWAVAAGRSEIQYGLMTAWRGAGLH